MRTRSIVSFLALACLLGGCRERAADDAAQQLFAETETMLSAKYGPFNSEAYLSFFGGNRSHVQVEPAPEWPGHSPLETTSFKNFTPMLNAVRHSPSDNRALWAWFAMNDRWLRGVDEVLAGGRMEWGSYGWLAVNYQMGHNYLDYTAVRQFCLLLRLRGNWAIAQGQSQEAVEWFDRLGRLSASFIDGKSSFAALTGVSYLQSALGGHQSLIWSDASPEVVHTALQRLDALAAALPERPMRDARRYEMLWYASHLRGAEQVLMREWLLYGLISFFEESDDPASPPRAPAIADDAFRNHLRRLSRRLEKQPSVHRWQLTMLPALAKRFEEYMPREPLFQRDIGVSPAELARLSSEAKLLLAVFFLSPEIGNLDAHAGVAHDRLQQLRLALAARLYRAETGRDPQAPAELVPRYLPAVPPSEFGRFEFRRIGDATFWARALARRFNLSDLTSLWRVNPSRDLSVQVNHAAPLTVTVSNGAKAWSREERGVLDSLEAALKGYPALVESVERRETFGAPKTAQVEFVARFRPNLNPLVVVSPGPSRQPVSAGPPAVYDSAKGALSPGALVTLVHF